MPPENQDREAPDFILRDGDRLIGVEVTQMTSQRAPGEQNPREASRLAERILEGALANYRGHDNLSPVHLDVTFRPNVHLSRSQVDDIATRIANTVVCLADSSQPLPAQGRVVPAPYYDDEISCYAIWPCPPEQKPAWHAPSSGMIDGARLEDIQTTMASKEAKLSRYRQHAEELWLLIVCDYVADGLFIDPPEAPVQFTVQTGFDRVFCLSWTGLAVVEIPTDQGHCH